MTARLIAYLPQGPASVYWLDAGRRGRIGRAGDCEIRIDHRSVSRQHAELWCADGCWRLHDPGSRNGSFVAGERVVQAALPAQAWMRFGDVPCEFAALGPHAGERARQRGERRRQLSQTLGERLEHRTALPDLLQDTLDAVIELGDCERGFLLLLEHGGWRVRAWRGLDPASIADHAVPGGTGAVQLALDSGQPVVVNDLGAMPALGKRPSVAAAGLRSVVALPLHHGERLLALVYADSRRARAAITAIDLELLRAFAERAALWIATRRAGDALDRLAAEAPVWRRVAATAGTAGP